MIEQSVSLASNGVVKVPGYEQLVRFGYTKNRGVYRLAVSAAGEWEGLAIRCFWHVPGGSDPPSSLVVDGYVAVPSSVTAQPGSGCVTFEGSDGTKTVTSADLRYRVSANSGTEDGSMPEPGTPAWQELVGAVHTDATAADQAKTDAQTAAKQAGASAQKAGQALSDTIAAKEDALKAIDDKQTAATQAVDTARDKALQQVEASTKAAKTAASEAATSAGNADQRAQEAAGSLRELKEGIASGDFRGEPGTSPTVTVQDIAGGHRIVITDATGTSSVDVTDGKDATVDATLSQSGKAADAKVTGDALARKAVIDDTAVGTDAWSSKHIVDMLCPPLEETGNPVTCYPVTGYSLGCKVSWEPAQEGSGDPSPDNVRPIKGRDSVTVTRCGENLLNPEENAYNTYNPYGLTITYIGDNKVHLSGTYQEDSGSFAILDTQQKLLAGKGLKITGFTIAGTRQSYTLYGLRTKDETVIAMQAQFVKGDVIDMTVAVVVSDSQVPTIYTPYTGQTAALTLPRTIYGGTVDAVTGEGQNLYDVLTLTGEENWKKDDTYIVLNNATTKTNIPLNGVCSHFLYRYNYGGDSLFVDSFNIYLGATMAKKYALDEWKALLAAQYAAGTPVQIAYKLTTPTPFTATGVHPISALSGANTALTDADSVTVTGRADPIKRITDLEDAVASMTTT